jgi:hypothetical protein
VGELSRAQLALAAVAGIGILAAGFLAGGAIGNGDGSSSPDIQRPARIATRDSSVDVPTLGETKQIPRLEVKEQTAASTVEEGTSSTFTPSSPVEEGPAEETKTPSSTPEPEPEVTVAPNG